MNDIRQAHASVCFPGQRFIRPLFLALFLSFSFVGTGAGFGAAQQAIAPPAVSETKKIVFLSGPKDHGAPGRHESIKDLQVIQWVLENSSNLTSVTTQFYEGVQRPPLSEFSDAEPIMTLEDYRQFLVNGVAWAAGVEIPEEGILSGDPPAALGEPSVR